MKNQFIHDFETSFSLWFDHTLLKRGEAFSNQTGILTQYIDNAIPTSHKVYGSQFKEWVIDASIPNAIVPYGVSGNGTFVAGTGNNDNIIDYKNGRFISTGNYSTVSGAFSVKEFNVYYTNEDELALIVTNKYKTNAEYLNSGSYVAPYDFTVPCVFLTTENFFNEPAFIGGEDETKIQAKAVVFAENNYQMNGLLNVFSDQVQTAFANISINEDIYNSLGGISSIYNYDNLVSGREPFYYIERVNPSKMKDEARRAIEQRFLIGFLEFDIKTYRFPRA